MQNICMQFKYSIGNKCLKMLEIMIIQKRFSGLIFQKSWILWFKEFHRESGEGQLVPAQSFSCYMYSLDRTLQNIS